MAGTSQERDVTNVLALSDEVVPYIHSPTLRERFPQVDIVAGCGDLPASYLEYVVSSLNVPLVYVPGNHDPDVYRVPGGIDIDGRVVRLGRLTAAGAGGSPRYKDQGRHQYHEPAMHLRLLPLLPRLILRRMRSGYGMDLLVTHAPPVGIHDESDPAHRGFLALRRMVRLARPQVMLHGHCHLWSESGPVETDYRGTRVINIYPAQMIRLETAG